MRKKLKKDNCETILKDSSVIQVAPGPDEPNEIITVKVSDDGCGIEFLNQSFDLQQQQLELQAADQDLPGNVGRHKPL